MAKEPVAGRVKTRLCPPLTAEQAADVARASLERTFEAVAGCSADRRLLALDGEPGGWIPPGFEVFPQRGDGLAERLANAWRDAGGPGLQIGMDTPQVTPALLDDCLGRLGGDVTAALGLAEDGGWWAIGLSRDWDVDVFTGVPMSTAETGRRQLERLRRAGHRVALLPVLRDIDTAEDARSVAGQVPGTTLARLLERAL